MEINEEIPLIWKIIWLCDFFLENLWTIMQKEPPDWIKKNSLREIPPTNMYNPVMLVHINKSIYFGELKNFRRGLTELWVCFYSKLWHFRQLALREFSFQMFRYCKLGGSVKPYISWLKLILLCVEYSLNWIFIINCCIRYINICYE